MIEEVLSRIIEIREEEQRGLYVFKPRTYQEEVIKKLDIYNFIILCWARRLGKDLTAFSTACKLCLEKENSIVYYVFPSMKQGKMMILEGITNDKKTIIESVVDKRALKIPKSTGKLYHNDNTIRFKNGSIIYFVGSQNADTKVGGNLDLLILSEYATMKNDNILQFLIPSVINVKGKIIIVSTPRYGSAFNEMLEQRDKKNNWYIDIMRATDERARTEEGNIYTEDKLKQAKLLMSESKFEQEYMCNIDIANELSIYSNSLKNAKWVNSYEREMKKLYISFDLGINDSTSLVFVIDNTIIHHYQNVSQATQHYIDYILKFLLDNGFYLSQVELILPHDSNNRQDAVTHLISRRQAYQQAGFNITVLKAQPVLKSIEITRYAIEKQKLKFLENDTVRSMTRLMKQYEFKESAKGENLLVPVHGKGMSASNTCDSVEYFCIRTFLYDYEKNLKNFEYGVYID